MDRTGLCPSSQEGVELGGLPILMHTHIYIGSAATPAARRRHALEAPACEGAKRGGVAADGERCGRGFGWERSGSFRKAFWASGDGEKLGIEK